MYRWILIVSIISIIFFAAFRGSFINESVAVEVLESAGYSDVVIKDHKWFMVGVRGCGSDAARFDAVAKNIKGFYVKPFVCVGWPFKGATIRF